jgi:hypothetical protein
VLKDAGLVERERTGRFVTYRLAPRVRSARRNSELDFGCCRVSFKKEK